ncbi:septation protein SepH [Actinomadura rugatobispora]|uniref:Septation protein SepH n=1 Tax=Actinomadura rugatobispora TaxID=1994 RepID=A0ABW1A602_9ACTN|nr:hypothetical protein GCM10010200_012440 [Actinomadura rugatobispora]
MQELRLVAVSEDGTYLVLATAGRGTRFTLPVDDRLRAAVRGHFSRLGQFEIEVESPLRPKEIQARIRSGETAEEIAESAGIPVERVRWFEGPVLQEREYMAQQAQRVAVRRPGESTPGPPLGETVEERLGRGGVDLEEVEWDSWKCEDSTWRIRLSFFDNGRPHAAEWVFDPRRRHVSPLDEVAARLTAVEWDDDEALGETDTVTPLVPRRPAMKVVSDSRDFAAPVRPELRPEPLRAAEPPRVNRPRIAEPAPERRPARPSEPPVASRPAARPLQRAPQEPEERSTAFEPAEPEVAEAAPAPEPAPVAEAAPEAPPAEPEAQDDDIAAAEPEEPTAEEHEPEPEPEVADEPEAVQEEPAPEPEPAEEPVSEDEESQAAETAETVDEPEPEPEPAAAEEQAAQEPEPADEPAAEEPEVDEPVAEEPEVEEPVAEEPPPAAPEKPAAREKPQPPPKPQRPAHREPGRPPAKKKSPARPAMPAAPADKPVGPPAAAAAAAAAGESPAAPQRPARNRRKSKGKRASVPSWDEIMFGARRPD